MTISDLEIEYADHAGLIDDDTHHASNRVTSISIGSRRNASMEISKPKTKAMHIHKKVSVSATTEAEIADMHFKFVCPDADCKRDFSTARGLS